MKYRF